MRVFFNKVKGLRCYNDIKTVRGIILFSYEDVCYEFGLLDDDKEYIEGLKECSFWVFSGYVRYLFVKMLLFGFLFMSKLVWELCIDILLEDVLYIERKKRKNFGEFKKYIFLNIDEYLFCFLINYFLLVY